MARRSDHSREELENLIIDAAKNIVINGGFQSLTARRIAKDIGYTVGTLYHVFGSMDGICFAVNKQTLDLLFHDLSNPTHYSNTADLSENLKAMTKIYMDFAHDNNALWLMIFNHALPQGEKSPDWYRQKVKSLFGPLEQILSPLFPEGKEHEKSLAARVLWSSIHGICYMEETQKTPLISDQSAIEMAYYLIDHFIEGIKLKTKT